MNRITNQMINKNMVYNLQRHQTDMDTLQNQLATGKSVRIPRDNPVAATNQMLYQTRLSEIDQYIKNISETQARLNEIDT
ncbi:MAG TPA: flagellar biosynthesis protein FlgL, partial [Spirochaetota bacterium]|nr:flagellar biosynthesis protein FlgL [Spirochaetota bacterium]